MSICVYGARGKKWTCVCMEAKGWQWAFSSSAFPLYLTFSNRIKANLKLILLDWLASRSKILPSCVLSLEITSMWHLAQLFMCARCKLKPHVCTTTPPTEAFQPSSLFFLVNFSKWTISFIYFMWNICHRASVEVIGQSEGWFSFHHVSPGDWIQVVSHSGKCLFYFVLLDCLVEPFY